MNLKAHPKNSGGFHQWCLIFTPYYVEGDFPKNVLLFQDQTCLFYTPKKMVEVLFFRHFGSIFVVFHDLFQPSEMKTKHFTTPHNQTADRTTTPQQKVKQIGGKRDVDCAKAKCQNCISQKRGASTKTDPWKETNSLKCALILMRNKAKQS